MRIPLRSEPDAFRAVWAVVFLVGISFLLGSLVGSVFGVVLFAGGVLGAVVFDLITENPDRRSPLLEAARAGRQGAAGDKRRILVVANETVGGQELREEILRRGGARTELRVVAPVLVSRPHYAASDIDNELGDASRRLEATLAWAVGQGFEATGEVGDSTPFTAIEDELRRFAADEVIISTHPPQRSKWLESRLVERARSELDIPVTHVMVDLERQQVELAP
jgi:hypothetical protein